MDKLPSVAPLTKCELRYKKLLKIQDWLNIEYTILNNLAVTEMEEAEADQAIAISSREDRLTAEIDKLRGSPLTVASLEEIIDEDKAIISLSGLTQYVSICSFVDRDLLKPGVSVLCHATTAAIVGVVGGGKDSNDALINVMKVEEAPSESFADIGGLDEQIQELKETVELPLTHPELYAEIGIDPPKGCILYGPPGTGKTLLAKAVANSTSATFLRVTGSELVQKYLGDGPRLVREIFKTAKELAPAIVFIDEIDAVGTKRYDARSSGEAEVQRTMLELLNQLDGFDVRSDVKVLMATNRIDTLDPALIRPGRIDRKIELPLPDLATKRHIMKIHTRAMNLASDVALDEIVTARDQLSGADIKAICVEAGMRALRRREMIITMDDFVKAKAAVMIKKEEELPAMFM